MSALFHTFLEPCSGRSWPGRLSRHCCNGASRCMSSSPASTSVHRPYTFHIGASWAGKPLGRPKKRLTTPFAADSIIGKWRDHMLLRPKAVVSDDSGEDFFYIQAMRNNSGTSMGVADGVGGWVDVGVDPSLFSQSLMYHCHRYSRGAWAGEPEIDPDCDYHEREETEGWELTPKECLDLAYGGVLREKKVEAGSSTACIMNLNGSSGLLRAANIGDSGFSIIRNTQVLYRQPPQTHHFNFPRQLSKSPAPTRTRNFRGNSVMDPPSCAEEYEIQLRDGDVIVAYTDGLSDNVFSEEIVSVCSLISKSMHSDAMQAQYMADRLVHSARKAMMDPKRVSPFEREAARENMYFRGGKVDDVTVLVALVRES